MNNLKHVYPVSTNLSILMLVILRVLNIPHSLVCLIHELILLLSSELLPTFQYLVSFWVNQGLLYDYRYTALNIGSRKQQYTYE